MIIIGYHGRCPDGFAGAYAAWKKLGTEQNGEPVHYFPLSHDEKPPELFYAPDAEVYLIDFSYPKEELAVIKENAKHLVVLDHHSGAQEAVESVEHVFDLERSGVGIAWNYFHPGEKLPRLLAYVQQNDLWKGDLPHSKEIAAYLGTKDFTVFSRFDNLVHDAESDRKFEDMVTRGTAFREYYEYLCDLAEEQAELAEFAGYKVLAVNANAILRSEVGTRLAKKHGPFGIVYRRDRGNWTVSLRGDGSIDCAAIAQQFGGNGNFNAASFRVAGNQKLPFTFIPRHPEPTEDHEETH